MEKPLVFIGSSAEGLSIAEALFTCLSYETKPKLWTNQLFLPGQYPMEVLEKQVRQSSFAILVASPDDQILKRGVSYPSMRDNLLLEFGLFSGALGRKRTFFVCPSEPKIEIPSDLFGLIMATYDSGRVSGAPDEIAAAVQVPCQQIRSVIREEWKLIQKARSETAGYIRTSEKGKAIERLHGLVTQLRDAIVVVQRDAFAVITDESKFRQVKEMAISKAQEVSNSLIEDAESIGVTQEVQLLTNATLEALDALPFPNELALGKQAKRQKMVNTGLGALYTFISGGESGGDPFQHVEDVTTAEIDLRISSLQTKYMQWWEKSYPALEKATNLLQDQLFRAAMELALSFQNVSS